ncbi:MAG: type II secretion system F family protein [Patescibacteria group bacterium]
MADFTYQAADAGGRTTSGRINAPSRHEAMDALRAKGLIPLRLAEAAARETRRDSAGKPKSRDVLAFTQQLATLVGAGLQLDRALAIMAGLARGDRMGATLAAIRRDVQEGVAFSTALEQHPRLFSRIYVNMVRAGEAGGVLPVVLRRLAQTIEEERELRSFVMGALLYPAVVAAVSFLAACVLLLVVVPSFERIFAKINQDLPAITRLTVAVSHGLKAYGLWIAGGLAAAALAAWRAVRQPAGRAVLDRVYLRFPYFGVLYLKVLTVRLTRTMAMLVGAGVSVLQTFAVVKETVGNSVVAAALARAGQEIKEGGGVARRLEAQRILPPLAVQMIAVGEETGELASMLDQVAKGYDAEVRLAVRNLLSLMEPVLILCLTAMTLLIALSILIPLVSMNTGGVF